MGVLVSFCVAGIGVALFHAFALPLPWLLGPIFACLFAALTGLPLGGIKWLNDSMRTILGVAVGASLTPAVIAGFPSMWSTLIMVPLLLAVIGFLGVPYFMRLWGYDFATAYYGAMPGGLQDMLVFGEEAGANTRALALIHATRVMVIVVALPVLLKFLWDADLSKPPGVSAAVIPGFELLLMLLCALLGWRGAKWIGLFGASILGPLLLTAFVTVAGGLHHRPPAEAIWAAQFFLGISVGSRYAGITLEEIRRDLLAALGFCCILIVLTMLIVETIYMFDLAPGMEALLAFAPGGQAELTVLAIIVGADMAFVVAHHILRIFLVILGAPVAARIFSSAPRG